MLLAHVVEHMTRQEASRLIGSYAPYVRNGGRVVLIPFRPGYSTTGTIARLRGETP